MRKRTAMILGISAIAILLVVAPVAASCGGSGEETTTTAAPATTAAPTTAAATIDGAALYAENCAGCHADGVSGSASEIETIVNDGAGDMPAFGEELSAEEVAAVAAYAAGGGK